MRGFLFLAIPMMICLVSAEARSDQDLASLKEGFGNINSVKAEFLQKRTLPILTKPLLSEGRFFFQASGSLRWEYLSPLRSVMLQKGETIQLYHFSGGEWKPEMTQVVEARRMVIGEISRWFQGRFDDSKVFQHRYVSGSPGRIILTPSEGISKFISQIEIFLGSRPGIIEKVEIVEPGGSRTSIEFRKMEINSNISSEIFEKP